MLTITNILNPLTGGMTTEQYKWEKDKPIAAYIGYNGKCIISWNNEVINLPVTEIFPADREHYVFMPIPEGGDSKTWEILGGIISIIPSPIAKFALVAGALIVGWYLKEKDEDLVESSSYAWKHTSSPSGAQGTPLPVIYGKTRVRPVLKSRHIEMKGEKQYLYALYSVAGHRVDEIADETFIPDKNYVSGSVVRPYDGVLEGVDMREPGKTYRCYTARGSEGTWYLDADHWEVWHGTASFNNDIYINGRAISEFHNDVQWETRPGLPNQAVIDGFGITYTNYIQNQSIAHDFEGTSLTPAEADWFRPAILFDATENIEIIFEFPTGLYRTFRGEAFQSATANLFAQYSEYDKDDWHNFHFATLNIGDLEGERTYHDTSITSGEIHRKTATPFYIAIKAMTDNVYLDPNKEYKVRITADSPSVVNVIHIAGIVYGEKNEDGSYVGLSYPSEALLGIKALASGQISGELDVQVDAERSKVWVAYGHNQWVSNDANNHAWAVYDILANGHVDHLTYPVRTNTNADSIYGCGINHERIDYDLFNEWADNLQGEDGLGYELNIIFDTFTNAWDAILRICQEGRGMIYPMGSKICAFTDKPGDAVQLFTMGNIGMDSFVQKYTESAQKATLIETTFWDANNNYERTILATRTADWDESTELNTHTSMMLYGTDTFNQAWSTARYMLMNNELFNNAISFNVDVDALASQIGDPVYVQHDLLTGNYGGRIISHENDTKLITLDREVTMVAGSAYELKLTHAITSVTETADVVTNAGTTNEIELVEQLSTYGSRYDVYSFGIKGSHIKKYRIADISRTNELRRTLILKQYSEDLYTTYKPGDAALPIEDGQVVAPKIVPTINGDVVSPLNLASNVQLKEIISRNRTTGEYESSIIVSWDTELGHTRGSWEVWFRDVDVSDVDWQGEWNSKYGLGNKVEHGGRAYLSLEDDNESEPFIR